MPTEKLSTIPWTPDEVIVRVVEAADGYAAFSQSRRSEAGVYDPVFSLWEGTALLDFLFKLNDIPKTDGVPAPLLWLNLMVPKAAGAELSH
jgi:hypothetical protein